VSLLEVEDLKVAFPTEDGLVKAVQGVSFKIDAGQTLGIVGESGSGKSVSTQTIMGLTRGAQISGTATFEGRDLLGMNDEELRSVRGAKIAMIFQDPLSSLHPLYKVGWQIVEAIRAHEDISKEQARARAVELLGLVGIPKPDRRVDDFPHQFSGGMRQRAMIAMALSLNPAVLIADEPTTALDVTVQAQILDLIERLQTEFGTAVIMITHDLGVVADLADEVMVMYAGKPVEKGDRRTIYYRPHHPYTKGLLESIPASSGTKADRLKPIKGAPPSLISLPPGCSFHPRCPYVMDICRTEIPPLKPVEGSPGHMSACHLPPDEIGFSPAVEAARVEAALSARSKETAKLTNTPVVPNAPVEPDPHLPSAPPTGVRGRSTSAAVSTRSTATRSSTTRTARATAAKPAKAVRAAKPAKAAPVPSETVAPARRTRSAVAPAPAPAKAVKAVKATTPVKAVKAVKPTVAQELPPPAKPARAPAKPAARRTAAPDPTTRTRKAPR
jgi:oligopeptide/dipeptide ABC transporter ATP-binding protein